MSDVALLTPYLIPESLSWKTVNLGDGFILRGIERLVGRVEKPLLFSPRVEPSEAAQIAMGAARTVVLAGANQLNDNYRIWPGMTAEKLRQSRFVCVPMGVGIHGDPDQTVKMSIETRSILEVIHERVEFSSWRCPRTVAYLEHNLPHLTGRFLMTGCPVAYDDPVLSQRAFADRSQTVAVTATERGDFWPRDAAVLEFVAREFPRSRKVLIVHQNFKRPHPFESFLHRFTPEKPSEDAVVRFRRLARGLGFSILFPRSADEGLNAYRSIDMHFGSRLHAHLHMLSQNKRSFIVAVDDRARGMAEAFDFPVLEPAALRAWRSVDFEKTRAAIRRSFDEMRRFVGGLN